MIKSIYIHIPFCKKICTYCDFCKMYCYDNLINHYLDELDREVFSNYQNEIIETIYIGGGTPSCLNDNELDKLFSITDKINLSDNYEFTFECNIEDITDDFLLKLKNAKVNRISIGVESFNKRILSVLGRTYSFDIAERLNLVKKYFSNINIDLIYGVNGESMDDLKSDLNKFIALDINHISIYSLILENNTILKINNYEEIDDELSREMYDYIVNFLENNGFYQYEISNFAKNNTSSKHNLTYWNNERYYGFGLGASGYVDNIRYLNTRSITKYLNGNYRYITDVITKKVDMENFMILGLRKITGVSELEFYKRYGKSIKDVFDTSKLDYKDGNYFINRNNLYISNYILKDFVDI